MLGQVANVATGAVRFHVRRKPTFIGRRHQITHTTNSTAIDNGETVRPRCDFRTSPREALALMLNLKETIAEANVKGDTPHAVAIHGEIGIIRPPHTPPGSPHQLTRIVRDKLFDYQSTSGHVAIKQPRTPPTPTAVSRLVYNPLSPTMRTPRV